MTLISCIKPGMSIDCVLNLLSLTKRMSTRGNDYLCIEFTDGAATIRGYLWQGIGRALRIRIGSRVQVRGKAKVVRDLVVIEIESIATARGTQANGNTAEPNATGMSEMKFQEPLLF
jgi:hypothetical protein